MDRMRVGIVGAGVIADTHIEAILDEQPDAEISVCDPMEGKAELLCKKYQLKKAFLDMDTLLEKETPFSIHILSPPQFHVEQAEKALRAGAHVLVEKPLAFQCHQVEYLYELSREKGRALCVDHSLLKQPSVIKALDIIKSSDKNKVLYINSFYGMDSGSMSYSTISENHWKRSIPGGPIIDTLIHPISLAVELTGKPQEIVVKPIFTNGNIDEISVFWSGNQSVISIIVSTNAQPFQRVTGVVTNRQTFYVDHSTETLVMLDQGFGPKAVKKMYKNITFATQIVGGTMGTALDVVRKKMKQNPGTRGIIRQYYRHILGDGIIPVSEENARNATCVLECVCAFLEAGGGTSSIHSRPTESSSHKEKPRVWRGSILVTGASGFLGKRICEGFAERKYRVRAQVRRGANADQIAFPGVEKIYEDFRLEGANYERLVSGMEVVIHSAHAAGAKTWEDYKNVNVDASLSLYEAAAKANVEKFIFLSSVAVYGVSKSYKYLVTEETPTTCGSSPWDYYIKSKAMAENLLQERSKMGGPKLLIIRPGILYSNDGARLARRSIPLRERRLVISFGKGNNYLPYTRSDVLAESICNIISENMFKEGVYNFTGDPECGSREFIRNRMKRVGVDCKFITIPVFPLKVASTILEYIYFLTFRNSPPMITRYILNSGNRNMKYDSSKAKRDFNWDSVKAVE